MKLAIPTNLLIITALTISLAAPLSADAKSSLTPKQKQQKCEAALASIGHRTTLLAANKAKRIAYYRKKKHLWQVKREQANHFKVTTSGMANKLKEYDAKVARLSDDYDAEIAQNQKIKGSCATATGRAQISGGLRQAKTVRNKFKADYLDLTKYTDREVKPELASIISQMRAKKSLQK